MMTNHLIPSPLKDPASQQEKKKIHPVQQPIIHKSQKIADLHEAELGPHARVGAAEQLVEGVEVALVGALRHHPALLEEVVGDHAALRVTVRVELDLEVLACRTVNQKKGGGVCVCVNEW